MSVIIFDHFLVLNGPAIVSTALTSPIVFMLCWPWARDTRHRYIPAGVFLVVTILLIAIFSSAAGASHLRSAYLEAEANVVEDLNARTDSVIGDAPAIEGWRELREWTIDGVTRVCKTTGIDDDTFEAIRYDQDNDMDLIAAIDTMESIDATDIALECETSTEFAVITRK